MKTTERLQRCIDLKEAIKSLQIQIDCIEENKRIIGINFPKLLKKLDHNIEIKQMAIARLNLIFSRTLNKLNQEQ